MNRWLSVPLIVGVTGHCDVLDVAAVSKRLDDFFLAVAKEARTDVPVILLSSLAEGADRLFVKIGLEVLRRSGCDVSFQFVEPFGGYEMNFSGESLDEFKGLKSSASAVVELCHGRHSGLCGPEVKATNGLLKDIRSHRYFLAGDYIRMNSDVVVAVWDGRDSETGFCSGGTSDVVNYCLFPEEYQFGEYMRGRLGTTLVWHIRSDRRVVKGRAYFEDDGDVPVRALWRGGWRRGRVEWGPERWIGGCGKKIERLNRAGDPRVISAEASFRSVSRVVRTLARINCMFGKFLLRTPEANKSIADELRLGNVWLARRRLLAAFAGKYKMRARRTLLCLFAVSVLFGFFAQVFGGVDFVGVEGFLGLHVFLEGWGANFAPGAALGVCCLLLYLVPLALVVALCAFPERNWHWHGDFRAMAEFLRVQSVWTKLGVSESVLPYVSNVTNLETEYGINLIRNWMNMRFPCNRISEEAISEVRQGWIESQIHYYEQMIGRYSGMRRRCRVCGCAMFLVSISIAVWFLLHMWMLPTTAALVDIPLWWAYSFLTGIGPFGFACCMYVMNKFRVDELIAQYKSSLKAFVEVDRMLCRREIGRVLPSEERIEVVVELGKCALRENVRWLSNLRRSSPDPVF